MVVHLHPKVERMRAFADKASTAAFWPAKLLCISAMQAELGHTVRGPKLFVNQNLAMHGDM